MRADGDAVLARAARRVGHRQLVAVVAAAGHVRRVDQRPDLVFAGRAFAHVRADVDHSCAPFVSGRSQMSAPPRTKKNAAAAITVASPCVCAAAPMAYGAAAEARRPLL